MAVYSNPVEIEDGPNTKLVYLCDGCMAARAEAYRHGLRQGHYAETEEEAVMRRQLERKTRKEKEQQEEQLEESEKEETNTKRNETFLDAV
jgi:predicted Fe-S protein YdhL (DUF1289 family)